MKIEATITYGLAAHVWWHLAWRFVLFSLVACFIVSFVVALVAVMLHLQDILIKAMPLGWIASGLIVSIWVVKNVLAKKYKIGGYRLALVKEDAESVQ